MADYTDHDERASLVTQQELDRVALTKQKKEANECMYCRRQAIRTNLGTPVCWIHNEEKQPI